MEHLIHFSPKQKGTAISSAIVAFPIYCCLQYAKVMASIHFEMNKLTFNRKKKK